jgi:hypothetical protein
MFLTAEELAKRAERGRSQLPSQLLDDLKGAQPGRTATVYDGRTPAERWFCERLVLVGPGQGGEVACRPVCHGMDNHE